MNRSSNNNSAILKIDDSNNLLDWHEYRKL